MEIRSNVLCKEKTNEIIKATLIDIAKNVAQSLGPYGSTTILEDPILNHVITKDGYTILTKLKYNNEVSTTVFEIIKKISRSLVREVGDGSTSSITISTELYIEIEELLNKINVSPKVIIKILKSLGTILEKEIKAKSIPITEDNFSKIEDVATVSNNNDKKLGKLIADLYKKIGADGFITLDNSKTSEDYYEIKDGYELQRGYIDNLFINSKNKIDFEAEKPLIFICNDTLTEEDLKYLQELIGMVSLSLRRPLVIIAKDYDSEAVNFLKINKMQNRELNIVATDFSLINENSRGTLQDFAVYVGATIYDKYGMNAPEKFDMSLLGTCEKTIISEKSARFISGNSTEEEIAGRLSFLEEELSLLKIRDSKEDMSNSIFQIQKRISLLSSTIATFYVGGNSEIEKENRKFLLEDSIYSCQSTIRNGYIIGGNLIIPLIITEKSKEILNELTDILKNEDISVKLIEDIINIVKSSFLKAFDTVIRNYKNDDSFVDDIKNTCLFNNSIYNLTNYKYETYEETSIINSASTDIEIMKATFSIIGLLATSNQFISRSLIREEYYR